MEAKDNWKNLTALHIRQMNALYNTARSLESALKTCDAKKVQESATDLRRILDSFDYIFANLPKPNETIKTLVDGSFIRDDGYRKLRYVLIAALKQASEGKGKERHATTQGITRPFEQQPICTLGRIYGHGYNCGQAAKKAHEAMELPPKRAKQELLGAIVYLAAAYLLLEEREAINE